MTNIKNVLVLANENTNILHIEIITLNSLGRKCGFVWKWIYNHYQLDFIKPTELTNWMISFVLEFDAWQNGILAYSISDSHITKFTTYLLFSLCISGKL